MEEAFKYGPMAQDMTDSGRMISLKAMEGSSMLRETCMKDNGRMIKRMVLESIHIAMGTDTLETGKKINNTVRVLKYGLTIRNTMDTTSSE